jgi:heme/copper-type cytochrome/quinol oxidase subunit 2
MTQSMISLVVGIVVLLCVAILAATRYRREHKDEPVARWRDVHPIRDWLHHKP